MVDEARFRHWVARHELACRQDPTRFAWVTAAWAVGGLAVLAGVAGAALALLLWSAEVLAGPRPRAWAAMAALGALSLLWAVLRAVWVRQPPLQGKRLQRDDAPRLFDLIDQVADRCRAPRPHWVVIDAELNAGVSQRPRLGVLGWHRHVLHIGLPLLLATEVKPFAAILAHEFGHLRGAHHAFDGWLYRTRRSWVLLARARQGGHGLMSVADVALQLFFSLYLPRFDARARVLSRQMEIAADRLAGEAFGAPALARALVGMEVQHRYLDEVYWPALWDRAAELPRPDTLHPLRELHRELPRASLHPDAPAWLKAALKALPQVDDTHPALRERLERLGEMPRLPAPPRQTAAEALLGRRLPALVARVERLWREQATEAWQARHRHLGRLRTQLDALEAQAAKAPLSTPEALQRARLGSQLLPQAEAEALWLDLAQAPRPAPEARWGWARRVLARRPWPQAGEPMPADAEWQAALAHLQALTTPEVMAEDARWALPAARWLERLQQQRDDDAALRPLRERRRALEAQAEAAQAALMDLFEGPQQLAASPLGASELQDTLHALRHDPAVGAAYLLCKTDPAHPGWSLHLLVIERSRAPRQPSADDGWMIWKERLSLPVEFLVLDLAHPTWRDPAQAAQVETFRSLPGACIHRVARR